MTFNKSENSQPLISVVLCTYNGERFLDQQMQSILAQTYPRLEIIVCDDASTDNTVNLIKSYRDKDERIKLFVNATNLGYNKNFENAMSYATAEWIAIADQDDIWLPEKLTALQSRIQSDTLLVHSYNAEFTINPDQRIINPSRLRFKGSSVRQLLFYNTISGHTMFFHKKLLAAALPFPEKIYYDWWLGVKAALISYVQLHPDALVLHRQHASNASHLTKQLPDNEIKQTFFLQRIQTLQQFVSLKELSKEDRLVIEELIELLKNEWSKSFSFPVFWFFLRHAKTAFYFRKKTPMFFYYFKYSLKRASMKVKHWT